MLDRRERPSTSDRFQSAGYGATPKLGEPDARRSTNVTGGLDVVLRGRRATFVQPRLVVGLALLAAGLVWAVARGLQSYGLTPADLAYDLDQPPLLLVFVGVWLLCRRRRP